MKYEDMSDQQINEAITLIQFDCQGWSLSNDESFFYHCGVTGDEMHSQEICDYCKNPADWGQLIQDNKINLTWDSLENEWYTSTGTRGQNGSDPTKPGRAVSISYLKSRELSNG